MQSALVKYKYSAYVPLPDCDLGKCACCLEKLVSSKSRSIWSRVWRRVDLVAHENAGQLHPIHLECMKKAALQWKACCPTCKVDIDPDSLFSWKDRVRMLAGRMVRGVWSGVRVGSIQGVLVTASAVAVNGGGLDSTMVRSIGVGALLLIIWRIKPIFRLSLAILDEDSLEGDAFQAVVVSPRLIRRSLVEGATIVGSLASSVIHQVGLDAIPILALLAVGLGMSSKRSQNVQWVALAGLTGVGSYMAGSISSVQVTAIVSALIAAKMMGRLNGNARGLNAMMIASALTGAMIPFTGSLVSPITGSLTDISSHAASLVGSYVAGAAVVGLVRGARLESMEEESAG